MAYKDKTPEQQQDFKILHDGLVEMYGDKRIDPHFDMGYYQSGRVCVETALEQPDASEVFTEHRCDTSACVLGHGPILGIKGNNYFSWCSYSRDSFGVSNITAEWFFLFSEKWTNDIQEAVGRLKMYIEGFDPENSDWNYDSRYSK